MGRDGNLLQLLAGSGGLTQGDDQIVHTLGDVGAVGDLVDLILAESLERGDVSLGEGDALFLSLGLVIGKNSNYFFIYKYFATFFH